MCCPCRQPRFDLGYPVNLKDDARNARFTRAPHGLGNITCHRNMIVLDHRRVPQPHPVVGRTAHPRRIFLNHAQSGNGLAGIEQRAAGSRYGINIFAGHRGDTRQMLHGIQSRALCRQHRACIPAQPHQIGSGRHQSTFVNQHLNLHRRVQMAKERHRNRQPRDNDGIAAVHHPGKPHVGGDNALRSDVAARWPEIFGKRGRNESLHIESG